VSAGRVGVGVGVALLARPRALPVALGVDSGTAARVSWVVRMVGARDVALGLGTLLALHRGEDARDWLLGQALSDAADAAAFAGAVARGHARVVPGSAGALVAGASAATLVRALLGAGPGPPAGAGD
jgi:hypothetical protein